ncbi:hypothetical protein [Embleya sp. NPDC020630]|uniref:hypothetical protein n=1 Tax=Embleya sp. NPDC020630 TaxID=3363979 RepID=UPI0037B1F1F6
MVRHHRRIRRLHQQKPVCGQRTRRPCSAACPRAWPRRGARGDSPAWSTSCARSTSPRPGPTPPRSWRRPPHGSGWTAPAADLPAADARGARLAARVRRLEARLGEVPGERVRRESGIGGPEDTERLKARITTLEQRKVDLEPEFRERDDDLAAARTANRELMARLNRDRARREE